MERVDEHGTSTEDLEKSAMSDIITVKDRPVDESKTGGLRNAVKEMLFPDDPFRRFRNQPRRRKWVIGLQYAFPIVEWLPTYSFGLFKSDIISGITIASLAIPQGISYAKLANLPPVMGLCGSLEEGSKPCVHWPISLQWQVPEDHFEGRTYIGSRFPD